MLCSIKSLKEISELFADKNYKCSLQSNDYKKTIVSDNTKHSISSIRYVMGRYLKWQVYNGTNLYLTITEKATRRI